mmetsp:Transcript_7790/g.11862  ORF Transcript_7790/g.11862 Transcript_7790/m.11862 type:complete len:113 (-) Transcript_7790:360-698(-)
MTYFVAKPKYQIHLKIHLLQLGNLTFALYFSFHLIFGISCPLKNFLIFGSGLICFKCVVSHKLCLDALAASIKDFGFKFVLLSMFSSRPRISSNSFKVVGDASKKVEMNLPK